MSNNNTLEYPSEEFIPYACYIDKTTILTKNADVLCTFKIPSFVVNKSEKNLFNIRDTIQFLLETAYKNQHTSFYFTTIRKKANIIPEGESQNYFSNEIKKIWNEKNNWTDQYVNEIFITIIVSSDIKDNLFNPIYFLQTMLQSGINSYYLKRIEIAKKILKKIQKTFLEKLADYDVKLLTMQEGQDGTLYSENMRFFSMIINLEKFNFPVTYDAISDVLRKKKISYHYDYIETEMNEKKKFSSVVTLKGYQIYTPTQLDKILQLPMELIITETCSFADSKYVSSKYKEEQEMITLSEDIECAEISGLDDIISSDKKKNTDFCYSQKSIMIIANTEDELTENIKKLYEAFDEIGMVGVRENVFLPTIFWSQLPANFRYLKRFFIAPTKKLGTFATLFNFPVGKLRYNYWGEAIVVIPTAIKTPYFFNFHNQAVGNTIIAGLKGTGKTTIMNFLLSQTANINPKILYIDTKRSSEVFINAMGGKYLKVSPNIPKEEQLQLNPFMMENTPQNQTFLVNFIKQLVDFQDDGFIEMGQKLTQLKSQYDKIPNIISKIMSMSKEQRTFENVINAFKINETNLIYQKLIIWFKDLSFIFNHNTLEEFNEHIIGISLKTILSNKNIVTPVVYCLFKFIYKIANDSPFIVAIDDAWEIIDNPIIAPLFIDLIENGPTHNVATIVTTSGEIKLSESSIIDPIIPNFATEIYFGNPKINLYYKKIFCVQEDEGKVLSYMKLEERNFLLKCINDIVISSINLDEFKYYKKILSNDNISINAMKKAKEKAQDNAPEKWIPLFIELLEDYDKVMTEKKLKETEMNQIKWEESKNDGNNQNKIMN